MKIRRRQAYLSFFLPPRLWNEAEGCYMAWERKRGKLDEFNCLLRGAPKIPLTVLMRFLITCAMCSMITLDADTGLPRCGPGGSSGLRCILTVRY